MKAMRYEAGVLYSQRNGRGQIVTLDHDDASRLKKKTYGTSPSADPTLTWSYQSDGLVAGVVGSNGNTTNLSHSYDPMGRLTGTLDAAIGKAVGYEYCDCQLNSECVE